MASVANLVNYRQFSGVKNADQLGAGKFESVGDRQTSPKKPHDGARRPQRRPSLGQPVNLDRSLGPKVIPIPSLNSVHGVTCIDLLMQNYRRAFPVSSVKIFACLGVKTFRISFFASSRIPFNFLSNSSFAFAILSVVNILIFFICLF